MKLLSIEINCTRGIKNLKINLSGNNSVIYGDNGTGKSGIIDAIDFLLRGDITRLAGLGSKNLSLGKHGKYVTEDIKDSWVKAEILLPNFSETIVIERHLDNPSVLICDSKYEKDLNDIKQLADLHSHYLSRREILQFINSTEQKRAENIERLLNLYTLDKNRTILLKVKKHFEEELKSANSQKELYIRTISEKLQVDESGWLNAINDIRFQLGAIELTSLSENNIASDVSLTKTAIPKTEVSNLIQRIGDIVNVFDSGKDSLYGQIKQVNSFCDQISLIEDYNKEVQSIILFEYGKKLITENACPLCGQPIVDKDELINSLNDKISILNKTKELVSLYKAAISKLKQTVATLLQLFNNVNLDKLEIYIKTGVLIEIKNEIEKFEKLLTPDMYRSQNGEEFIKGNFKDRIEKDYLNVLFEISASMTLNIKEENYNLLIDINSKYNLYLKQQQKVNQAKTNALRAALIFKEYVEAQTTVLNQMYDSIQERFSYLYKKIHETDESGFESVFNRKQASLDLQVKFKDGNLYPPNAVHSEGHQDSMGICLFFALSEKISNDKINIVLLDDVVMSIDIDHRKNFCKILKEEFPNKQFIITTHDYIWRKELENSRVVKKENVIHFKTWDIKHGPYVEVGNNIWASIENHLFNGNKGEAIGLMRYYMEEFFRNICARYRLKVPYSALGQWTLEDVIVPSNAFYKKAYKKAKDSAASYGKDTTNIDKYAKRFDEAFKILQVERWTINPGTHFTEWAQTFSISDLKVLCSAVRTYCESYECPNCGSIINVSHDINGDPQSMFCDCGDVSFSCIKK